MKYDFITDDIKDINLYNDYDIAEKLISKSNEVDYSNYKEELKTVGGIMSLCLNRVDFHQPYIPMIISPQGRSFDVIDLDEKMANHIFNVIENRTSNIYILAKVFDILWITKKIKQNNPIAGEKATNYTLQLIKKLIDNTQYYFAGELFQRYVRLALSLNKRSEARHQMFVEFEKCLKKGIIDENEYFIRSLYKAYINTRISFGEGDKEICETILKNSLNFIDENFNSENIVLMEYYFGLAVTIAKKLKLYDKLEQILLKNKDYYLNQIANNTHPCIKVNLYRKVIGTLRKIPGNKYKETIKKMQKNIEDIQPLIIQTMYTFSSDPIDITKEVKEAEGKIRGKDIFSALKIIAQNMLWISEDYVFKNTQDSILEQMVTTIAYNDNGQRKNSSTYTPANNRCIYMHYELLYSCTVIPMLRVFKEEHLLRDYSFVTSFANHFLIPQGYEKSYSKGIYYFLSGEYFEAAHILIPLFENSLRYWVNERHPVSYEKSKDNDVNHIKIADFVDKMVEDNMLDETLAFNIKYFFGDNDVNLRNELAHGLLTFEKTNSLMVICGLSLIFFMIMYPYFSEEN